jgi:hypothetical protein
MRQAASEGPKEPELTPEERAQQSKAAWLSAVSQFGKRPEEVRVPR